MAIKIVYYSEVIDNWGRTESSTEPEVISKILKDSDNFTDDMSFEDENGRVYNIDDLIGKEVILNGIEPFTVINDLTK
jgi:hypothetical protein